MRKKIILISFLSAYYPADPWIYLLKDDVTVTLLLSVSFKLVPWVLPALHPRWGFAGP
jgi:hypothetical protein